MAVLVQAPAFAQDFRIIDPAGAGLKAPHEWPPFTHWDLREMPGCAVPWAIGAGAVPDLDGNGIANQAADRGIFIDVCDAGFDRWDAVTPCSELNFTNSFAGGLPAGGFVADSFNTMSWSAVALGAGTNAATVVLRSAATGIISEADIVFNSAAGAYMVGAGLRLGTRQWVMKAHGAACDIDLDLAPVGNWLTAADGDTDVDGDGIQDNERDLGTIATHEIGHLVGLDHTAPLGTSFNDPANPIMNQFWTIGIGPNDGGWANLTLKDPDMDGENFLYCPDLGDAPDPWMGVAGLYPSLVHIPGAGRVLNGLTLDGVGPGAEHIFGIKPRQPARNWTYEWLGRRSGSDVDSECEANIVDNDPFDDGVTWFPNPPVWGRPLCVTAWARYASDNVGNAHDYATYPLFANAWLDINQNCIWEEWFLSAALTPAPPAGANAVMLTTAMGYIFLPPIVNPALPVWLRCRLDYGEDVGLANNIDGTLALTSGAAQFGEVEDYPFWCFTKYEQQWVQNVLAVPTCGVGMIFVGQPAPQEETWAAEVDDNDCVIQPIPPSQHVTYYDGSYDETVTEYVPSTLVPPGRRIHTGKCKPNNENLTLARTYWLDAGFMGAGTATPPIGAVAVAHRIPSVNCGLCLLGTLTNPSGLLVTVGALDQATGGWIGLVDPNNHTWDDSMRVTVSYRVSPGLVPLCNLSPCDPMYSQLPMVPVGLGTVTPEDGFNFALDVPGDIQPGQSLIVEIETSWSQNPTINRQLVEFPNPIPPITSVGSKPEPSRLALENHPNPFNPSTMIRYSLPEAAAVTLRVYDVQGRLVRTLASNLSKPAGVHEIEWNGADNAGRPVPSGVYFYRLNAGGETLTRKAVLLK